MTVQAAPALRKHRNMAQTLAELIAADIQNGVLKPGQKLPSEPVIMAEHSVSRTVVREAISQLQANRFVKTRHGIGTFVQEPDEYLSADARTVMSLREVLAVIELRISLEADAARLAASRRTPEQLEELRAVLAVMQSQQGGPSSQWSEADLRFHQLVAKATGNRYFVDVLRDLGSTIIPRTRHLANVEPETYNERMCREHGDIFNAIERKDSEAARAAMRMHLSNSRERLRRAQEALERGLVNE